MYGQTTMEELAAAWADATCSEPQMRQDFVRVIREAVQRNIDVSLAIGWKLTKSRRPYIVYLYAGHFFVFALTAQQARNLEVDPNTMLRTDMNWPQADLPWPQADLTFTIIASAGAAPAAAKHPFTINHLEIDNCRNLDGSAAITGRLHYELAHGVFEPVGLVLEVSLHKAARKRLYMYPPGPLGLSGVIELRFPPIRDTNLPATSTWCGTTGAFCRFIIIPVPQNPAKQRPLSSPYGLLLDVLPMVRP